MTPQPYAIPAPVMQVLSGATVDNTIVRLPDVQLERNLYTQVNEVLEAIGGKWNRHKKGHVFDEPPGDELSAILRAGEVYRHKDYQYFPTPLWLAEILADMAFTGVDTSSIRVLEPSAGTGRLIDGAAKHRIPVDAWTCYEINPTQIGVLLAKGLSVREYSFLDDDPDPRYDAVVMNPPFSRGQDIEHVTHAWRHLRPGGRLVGIMSRGVTTNMQRRAVVFRTLVENHGWFEDVPDGAFEESGTGVSTTIVVLDKE